MTTNYPGSLDDGTSLPVRGAGDAIVFVEHNTQSDAIKALEAKLGIGATTPAIDSEIGSNATGESYWRPAKWIDVRDHGAVLDGTTNDAAAIQAAFNAAAASSVAAAVFLPGDAAVSTTLTITTNGVSLIGPDSGHLHDASGGNRSYSSLIWTGAAGGTILKVEPVENASNQRVSGNHIERIGFIGGGSAAIGLQVRSCYNGIFDVYGEHCTTSVVYIGCVHTLGEARDSQKSRFRVEGLQSSSTDGSIVQMWGDATAGGTPVNGANTSMNTFEQINGKYYNDAIIIGATDHNLFELTHLFRVPGGTGHGIRFKAGNGTTLRAARKNLLLMMSVGAGGLIAEGTDTNTEASGPNTILVYDEGNAATEPVLETAAQLSTFRDEQLGTVARSAIVSADQTSSSASYADITALTFPVIAGKNYSFRAQGTSAVGGVTTGLSIAFNFNGGGAANAAMLWELFGNTAANLSTVGWVTAVDTAAGTSSTDGTAKRWWRVEGHVQCTTSGQFVLRVKRNGTSANVTIQKGSMITWWTDESAGS